MELLIRKALHLILGEVRPSLGRVENAAEQVRIQGVLYDGSIALGASADGRARALHDLGIEVHADLVATGSNRARRYRDTRMSKPGLEGQSPGVDAEATQSPAAA